MHILKSICFSGVRQCTVQVPRPAITGEKSSSEAVLWHLNRVSSCQTVSCLGVEFADPPLLFGITRVDQTTEETPI
jgi:hypothetical protein